MEYLIFLAGLVAGFIDAIVGGGGLITLPALLSVLGSGPEAIGTNKIVGTSAALAALWVYRRAGHFVLGQSVRFSAAVGVGAVLGSLVTPYLPPFLFRWFILFLSPGILWLISQREVWTRHRPHLPSYSQNKVLFWGLLAGFYDGMWGPGGGTFLFLVLFLGAKLPLMQALASSKLANVCSASFSLGSFALRGYVHWHLGLWMASAIVLGALAGAQFANRSAAKVVRPLLVVVTGLLVVYAFTR
jgi:uncharacterized membrane protein YfcA